MAEADWHLKDLLHFYVTQCRTELLRATEDAVRAETLFDSVRRVRELMLLMSCMVGAFTPSEIAALNRLDQIRLVAENESAQMLRVGEDMALLRMWLKTGLDCQWNVVDAMKLLRFGQLSNSSSLPEMTVDLLTSCKKPFIVPSSLPSNAESIRRVLQTSIASQFAQAKAEFPYVPERVRIGFNTEDDSVSLFSEGEFRIKGIFDHRRWTVIEAQILDDAAGAFQCRQILQALSTSSISEMCVAALRMATAQKMKVMQDEATALVGDASNAWCSLYSLTKALAGLGNGFVVSLYKRLDVKVQFEMNADNGDFLVSTNQNFSLTDDYHHQPFLSIIQSVERLVGQHVLGELVGSFFHHSPNCLLCPPTLTLLDHGIAITLSPKGQLVLQLPSLLKSEVTVPVEQVGFQATLRPFVFIAKLAKFLSSMPPQCASPVRLSDTVELTSNLDQNFQKVFAHPESHFSISFRQDSTTHIFDVDFKPVGDH